MRVCVAGAYGAFGIKHLDAIANIEDVQVTSVMGPTKEKIEAFAAERGIGHAGATLEECLERDDVDAVILATPTQMHADQAVACMEAGKHVLVEIPMADSLADSQAVVAKQKETGLVAMAGQVRRFNPSHQWIHNKIKAGEVRVRVICNALWCASSQLYSNWEPSRRPATLLTVCDRLQIVV